MASYLEVATMSGYDEAFLFLEPGTAGGVEREALEHSGGSTTALVWVADEATAAAEASRLAGQGVRLIELYRGFDLVSAAAVIEAVGGRAPVGVAGFGPGGASAGRPRHSVTIYADESADPGGDRVVHAHPDGGTTTVVGAGDADVVRVAEELLAGGADLLEVCGGTPLTTAARIAAAVGDRVPVSLVSWPFESIDGAMAFKAASPEAQAHRP